MNRFSMDYTPVGHYRQVRGYLLACLLVTVSIVLLGSVRLGQLQTYNTYLRAQDDAHRLRYDSLLSAKLEADRRLHLLLKQTGQSNGFLTKP
jgi:hypothetical protein